MNKPEVVKILLLVAILATLLNDSAVFENVVSTNNEVATQQTVESGESGGEAGIKDSSKEFETDIIRILEAPLRSVFKYPEEVNFSQTVFDAFYVRGRAGFLLASSSQDLGVRGVSYCGYYSAKNGMGAYGPLERFFILSSIDEDELEIGAEIYFELDGEFKQLFAIDSNYPLDFERDKFQEGWQQYCPNAGAIDKGIFADYKLDGSAFQLKLLTERYEGLIKNSPDLVSFVKTCTAIAGFDACVAAHECIFKAEQGKTGYCGEVRALCPEGTSKDACIRQVDDFVVDGNKSSANSAP